MGTLASRLTKLPVKQPQLHGQNQPLLQLQNQLQFHLQNQLQFHLQNQLQFHLQNQPLRHLQNQPRLERHPKVRLHLTHSDVKRVLTVPSQNQDTANSSSFAQMELPIQCTVLPVYSSTLTP